MESKKMSSIIFTYTVIFIFAAFSVHAWANPAAINLGEASNFAVLSKVAITNVPASVITGDMGVSPAAGTFITGFTCPAVTGTVHVVSAGGPTLACQTVDPDYLTPTIGSMQAAFTDAYSRAFDVTMGGDIGGQTLTPGVYTTANNLGITSDLTLNCNGNTKGVFIFRIGGKLDLSASTNVVLINGCQTKNVFWAVSGITTVNGGVGAESTFSGTVLGGPATTEITVITGSTVNGRLLGEKTIALQKNTITLPTDATDYVAPVITLNTPNNFITTNNQSSLNFTFVDAVSTTANCNLYIDGVLHNASLTTNNNTLTSITPDVQLTQGAHTWYVNCMDLSENVGTSTTKTINIAVLDIIPPVVSLVSPITSTWSTDVTPAFTFKYVDASSSTASCTLFVEEAALGTNSLVVNNTNTIITANASLSQGSNNWYVNCTDQSNNVGKSSVRAILIDSIYPISLINNVNDVSNGYGTNTPTLVINFTANDINLKNWTLSLYNSNLGLLQSWIGNTINLSAVETYTVTSNGTYYVNLTVRDDASNINSTLFTVYVDQSAPVINNLSINSLTSSSAILTVNASDVFSGIYNCNYSNAGNGSLTLSGGLYTATLSGLNASTTYLVNVTCYDKTGYFVSNIHNFTTNAVFVAQSFVNLGTAGNFVILAESGISTTGTTVITGDIGISPAAASYITGFGLVLNNTYATSSLITGNVYAADYAPPTPTTMTTAVSDMETAYTDAAGRINPFVTELGAGNIGGMTLAPGLYKWGTGVTIPTDVTLSGNSSDVWVFQIAQNLDISNGKKIILSGGANASNIFWQVAGQATLGTTSVFNGNILSKTAIVLDTGAVLNGRALAQTAVTLDANTLLLPIAADKIPPTTVVVNPGSSWINTNFNITLNATGYTNVSYINYTLNNVSHQINSSFYEVLINESGNYTLTYYAVDLSGNIESLKTIHVLLDKIAPNTTFALSPTSAYLGDTITGTCTATDSLDSNPSTSITGISTSTTGSRTATCTATDAAGNTDQITLGYTVSERPSSGSSGGGGGPIVQWDCTFSECSLGETYVKTCTRQGSSTITTEIQSCTPSQEFVVTPVDQNVDNQQQINGNEQNANGQNAGTTDQQNNNATQLAKDTQPGGNLLTGAVIGTPFASNGLWDTLSNWWNSFVYWISHLFS